MKVTVNVTLPEGHTCQACLAEPEEFAQGERCSCWEEEAALTVDADVEVDGSIVIFAIHNDDGSAWGVHDIDDMRPQDRQTVQEALWLKFDQLFPSPVAAEVAR